MKFTDELFCEISLKKKKNSFKNIQEKLKQADSLGIWGTGLAGSMIVMALRRMKIQVHFFVDSDPKKVDTFFYGIMVKDVKQVPPHSLVIIAANVRYGLHKKLNVLGVEFMYLDPVYLYGWDESDDITRNLYENSKQIDEVYQMLADDNSRKVYKNILLHRAVHDLQLVWQIYDEHQYFGNSIVKQAKGCFVDCGAFQGDTLKYFLAQVGVCDYKYYALEVDRENYLLLNEYCIANSLEKVYPLNIGVWDRKEKISFVCDEITGDVSKRVMESRSAQDTQEVMVDSIDNILSDTKIDFIKMDIEGAEIKALHGARKSIIKNSPVLAVSAYHQLEHLWQIPILIKEFNANYNIHFGHHMWNMADTVCYALNGEYK